MSRRLLAMLLASLALVTTLSKGTSDASTKLRNGRFWLTCQLSHRLPDDPIMFPGIPAASHGHDFFGNVTTNAASTYPGMLGEGTTCALPADTAGYWVPTLWADDAPVSVRVVNAYYWGFRGLTTAFPPDLRMIAGATVDVPSGTSVGAKKVGWMCSRGGLVYAYPPDCGTEFLRMVVTFPSCWDGAHTDAMDHHSQLTYPSARACPSTHPVIVPRLVLHVVYDLHDGRGAELSSDMATGAPAGSTVHADFWNTWDQATLEHLVDTCINTGPNCVFRDS